jgi:hypothetical protein
MATDYAVIVIGGGVSGIPGHDAAREILRDWMTLR